MKRVFTLSFLFFYLFSYSQNNINESSIISFGYLRGYEIINTEVYHWGYLAGMTGTRSVIPQPSKFEFSGAKSIVCGSKNNFIIDTSGQLYSWGYNEYGEAGIGVLTQQPKPVKVSSNKKWLCVLSNYGSYFANYGEAILAIKEDSTLWGWGENKKKQIRFDFSDQQILKPIIIDSVNKYTSIGFDRNSSYALRRDGTLWTWGNFATSNMVQIGTGIKAIYGNSNSVYFIDSLGNLFSNREFAVFNNSIKWKKVSTGWDHALGLSDEGDVYSWGNNHRGQLGIGINNIQIINSTRPQKITNTKDYTDLATGEAQSMIRRKDSTLWSFGANINITLGFCSGSSPGGTINGDYYSPTLVHTNKTLIKPTFNTLNYSFCSGDSLKLVITNINNRDALKWYYGTKSDLTNISNKTFKDSTKLFVTRTDSLGCVISSDTISITKNSLPVLPAVKDTVFCQNISSSTLLATGTNGNTITWYGTNAIGGTGSASSVVASTTDTTTKSYFLSQINNTTSCESPRAKITVKINPAPASPSVKDTSYCNNISADTLKATSLTGHSLNWYGTNATGGTASILGNKPTTTAVGSLSYYVSQKNNTTGCESPRSKIGVTINPLPIAPVVRDTNYCNNASSDTLRFNTSIGATLLWYGTNATGGTGTITAIKPSTANVGTANYYLSQIITATGCEGPRSKVVVITKPLPSAPILSRDTANFLLSGAPGITWYKDGTALIDTAQKIKPTIPGSYTARTTQNGCTSALSNPYYYLVTDIINLSPDEFIKLAPNPFINQLNLDFVIKGYQRLNLEVFDLATGMRKTSMQNLTPGIPIYLGQLSPGTYYVRVSSKDGKINYQFKMIKL
jgi:alpha-tubulin suppressor-like RCC1 family protein